MDGSGAVVADQVASEDRVGAGVGAGDATDAAATPAATSPKDTIVKDAEEEIQPDDANTSRKRAHDAVDAPSPPTPTSTSTHPDIPPSTHTDTINGHDTTSPPKAKQQKLSPPEDTSDVLASDPQQEQTQQDPVRGGAPLRRYLNKFVTPALLDGMKLIAREQPNNPLERLAMFLLERSKDAPLVSGESISKE